MFAKQLYKHFLRDKARTPIVEMNESEKWSSAKRVRRDVLPTFESPT
jgi:hypothetical protein